MFACLICAGKFSFQFAWSTWKLSNAVHIALVSFFVFSARFVVVLWQKYVYLISYLLLLLHTPTNTHVLMHPYMQYLIFCKWNSETYSILGIKFYVKECKQGLNPFMTEAVIISLSGFYMITASVMKDLNAVYDRFRRAALHIYN